MATLKDRTLNELKKHNEKEFPAKVNNEKTTSANKRKGCKKKESKKKLDKNRIWRQ